MELSARAFIRAWPGTELATSVCRTGLFTAHMRPNVTENA